MNNYQSFAITATGESHVKHGKECQDASTHVPWQDRKKIMVAVADGHGDSNCFRSQKGAEIAVACARTAIFNFIRDLPQAELDKEKIPKDLAKSIIAGWQVAVENDYTKNPFTIEELAQTSEKYRQKFEQGESLNKAYGTTLIVAAVTEDYWLGIHIGDGRFTALYPNGAFKQPIPWDESCFLNATTSICDDDAAEHVRYHFSLNSEEPPPVAVLLCTDGIDDNYPVDENEKHLYKLYRTIMLAFANDGFESASEQLKDLVNKFATQGKADDTSLAGFIDMEGLNEVKLIWEKETEMPT